MTAVRLYDFLSCAGPRSSHQRQRFSTSHVVFYTWVCLQRPIHRPHPAERARCCIDRYRLVLIGTSIIFFECLTKVCSSFSPFEIAPTNEGIEPSNIRLSPMRDSARFLHTAPNKRRKTTAHHLTTRKPSKKSLVHEKINKWMIVHVRMWVHHNWVWVSLHWQNPVTSQIFSSLLPPVKGKLHSKIISSDLIRFLSVESNGEGPRSKFEQDHGQTDGKKVARASVCDVSSCHLAIM